MRVKIFKGLDLERLEDDVNLWMAQLPPSATVKFTQSAVAMSTSVASPGNSRSVVVLTVWYEDKGQP